MFTLLNALDHACRLLPAAARLGLYGLVAGALAMLIYWRLSPQRRILTLRQQIADARKELRAYTGTDVRVILQLSRRMISPALKQLLLILGPTLIALLPVLLVVAWLESAYTSRLPRAGDPVAVLVNSAAPGAESAVTWQPASAVKESRSGGRYIINWPARDGPVTLADAATGAPLIRLPLSRPVETIARPTWWKAILEGGQRLELPPRTAIRSVEFDLPGRCVWSIGPQWMRSWHAPFWAALTVAVLAMKFTLKIA